MNCCRICKYWYPNDHAIGMGVCRNVEVWMRIFPGSDAFRTAQDFGCMFHELGDPNYLLSIEDRTSIISDFIKSVKWPDPKPTDGHQPDGCQVD
jgi:hypothetical protein